MKTHYYLASVTNATSPAVRILVAVKVPTEALATAAMELARLAFHVSQLQELTEDQYFAPNNAPHCSNVAIRPEVLAPAGRAAPSASTAADTLVEFAADHARGLARGWRAPSDVAETIQAMKGEAGLPAAAFYVLEVVSHLPDSMEKAVRLALRDALAR